eukprot:gene6353-10359_t
MNEEILIDEILSLMMGVEGEYISLNDFSLENETFEDITKRILPLCQNYVKIENYVQVYSQSIYGYSQHALCAALKEILQNHLIFVGEIETQFMKNNLTLQKLWFYVQPSLRRFEILSQLLQETKDLKGGHLLSKIYEISYKTRGDTQNYSMMEKIIEKSCAPYFKMIENWIFKGTLNDPYDEFMIKSNENIKSNSKFWDEKFQISNSPNFLNQHSEKILSTGKNLYILNDLKIKLNHFENFNYSSNSYDYLKILNEAELKSNSKLLEMYFKKEELFDFLKYIKGYFFLEGDFDVLFFDLAEKELLQKSSNIDIKKIKLLLELSIPEHKYKKFLTCEFDKKSESNSNGFQIFQFNLNIKWPISIILNEKIIEKYQMIFKHLFYCKYIERNLSSWTKYKQEKNLLSIVLPIRHKMLIFLQEYQFYIKSEIIDKHFNSFHSKLKNFSFLNEILNEQNSYLQNCLKLIIHNQQFNIISQMMTTIDFFSSLIENIVMNKEKMKKEIIISKITEFDIKFNQCLKELSKIDDNSFINSIKEIYFEK